MLRLRPALDFRRKPRSDSVACSSMPTSTAHWTWSQPMATSTTPYAASAATSDYAQPPQLFLNNLVSQGKRTFRDVTSEVGDAFRQPKVGRGLAYGDFDRDGDLDILITTNNGPAYLYRNDQLAGNKSIRFRLVGKQSNRDAIGAAVRIYHEGTMQSRLVKSGSSYLSQSELPVTFGVGKRDKIERVVIQWPNGRTEEYKNLVAGKLYECVESEGNYPRVRLLKRESCRRALGHLCMETWLAAESVVY